MYSILSEQETNVLVQVFEELKTNNQYLKRKRLIGDDLYIIEKLGTGTYSDCFSLNNGLVLKTNAHSIDYKDDGQPHWLKYCINKESKHLPIVHFFIEENNMYLAVTEKLSQMTGDPIIMDSMFSYVATIARDIKPNDDISKYALKGYKKEILDELGNLIKTCNIKDLYLDVGYGNLLMRNDTIVLCDPIYGV